MDTKTSTLDQINNNPQYYRDEYRSSILEEKVMCGMNPVEALLASGGGVYKVKADSSIWTQRINPIEVLIAQCNNPDNSHIEIIGKNCSQFNSNNSRSFKVSFQLGRVDQIKEIK